MWVHVIYLHNQYVFNKASHKYRDSEEIKKSKNRYMNRKGRNKNGGRDSTFMHFLKDYLYQHEREFMFKKDP